MKGKTNAKSELFRGLETLKISVTLDGVASGITNGCEIYIQDANTGEIQTHIWNGEEITTTIPANHRYFVKAVKIEGYRPPLKIESVAEPYSVKTITFDHKTPPIGVYICDEDWCLYSTSEWDGSKNPIGIYVADSSRKRVISHKVVSGNYGAVTYYGTDTINGRTNTEKMIGSPSYTLAIACNNHIFPNGKRGYLAADRELQLVLNNGSTIQGMLQAINGDLFVSYRYYGASGPDAQASHDLFVYRYFQNLTNFSIGYNYKMNDVDYYTYYNYPMCEY